MLKIALKSVEVLLEAVSTTSTIQQNLHQLSQLTFGGDTLTISEGATCVYIYAKNRLI